MRIIEMIADWVLDTKIFEQALKRKEVESKITSISYPIVEHLIKVLKWKDDLNYSKHCSDIDNWLFDIQLLIMKGGKKPNQEDYYRWMFTDVVGDFSRLKPFILKLTKYKNLSELRSDVEVYDYLSSIIYQLSFDLRADNFKSIENYLP